MKVTVLGCGTSSGVPRVGGDWGACDPHDPRNARTRVSVLVEAEGYRVLVDTSPDLRAQLLAAQIGWVDAVIWTHDHADHCHGIDDLRALYHARRRAIPGWARARTLASLRNRFSYVFEARGGYPALVAPNELPDVVTLGPFAVTVVDQPHGRITAAGLRFEADGGSFGYATDCVALTDAMATAYAGLDLWIVDALRERPHPTHSHLAQTLAWIEQLRPKQALLTHMDQSMDYAALAARLPDGVRPAHDGLEIYIM